MRCENSGRHNEINKNQSKIFENTDRHNEINEIRVSEKIGVYIYTSVSISIYISIPIFVNIDV